MKKTGQAASSASQDWLKDGSFRNKDVCQFQTDTSMTMPFLFEHSAMGI